MSRHHLRHDKTCLNCGTFAEERYCTHCGQENTEPKESLGHLIGHFFADITHFDSQIFTTLKDLVLRPGFLTKEYAAGRRVRYLNPIRMYVFISAMFFLALFAGRKEHEGAAVGEGHAVNLFRQQLADSLRDAGGDSGNGVGNAIGSVDVDGGDKVNGGDSGRGVGNAIGSVDADGGDKVNGGDSGNGVGNAIGSVDVDGGDKVNGGDSVRRRVNKELAARLDTAENLRAGEESMFFSVGSGGKIVIDLVDNKYHSLREYDSVEPHLPDSLRHTGFWGWLARRNVEMKEKRGGRGHIRIEKDLEHTVPKLMFVLLPLFALYTGWMYSRKKYYYVQHAIFSIHFHSFAFLVFLALKLVSLAAAGVGLVLGGYLLVFVYLVAALRGMYGQGWGLSLVKGIVISLLYAVTIGLSLWVLVLAALMQA